MESRTARSQALIDWNKWFSAWNQYVHDIHVKWMKQFGHRMYEEEDGSSEDK